MHQKGINQEITQRMNRTFILKDLRRSGVCSRAQLAENSGLTQASVAYIMKEFLRWGLVRETGLLEAQKGRRSIGVSIDKSCYRVIGIRLSRKYYKIAVLNLAGELLESDKFSIPSAVDINDVIAKMCTQVEAICSRNSNEKYLAVGVALPGPFISKRNEIAALIGAEEWRGVNIKKAFEQRISLPVFLEHDSNAGAFSQMWHLGNQYHSGTLIYYSIGQGIGTGIIIDGQVYHGAMGIAGEIGHTCVDINGARCICGNRGCLDLYASSAALLNNINEDYRAQNMPAVTLVQVEELLRCGDEVCIRNFKKMCEYIGYSIINLVNLINPDIVVIGDEIPAMAPELVREMVSDVVWKSILPQLRDSLKLIVNTEARDDILAGAGIVAINKVFEQPEDFFCAAESVSGS